jgi:hypothetical protein
VRRKEIEVRVSRESREDKRRQQIQDGKAISGRSQKTEAQLPASQTKERTRKN